MQKISSSWLNASAGVKNIISTFGHATSTDISIGSYWYPSAYNIASRIAAEYRLSPYKVVGVIAALSPNNKWERNCFDAESLIKVFKYGEAQDVIDTSVCTYPLNKSKALKILELDDHDLKLKPVLEILKGPKVIEFTHSILGREDVCIDGHAYNIWLGVYQSLKDVPAIGKKLRHTIKQDYKIATKLINLDLDSKYSISTVQAITWVTHRRIYLNISE